MRDQTAVLAYETPEPQRLVLDGKVDGQDVHVEMRRAPTMRLLEHGFRWVNEYSSN